jgi:hypothetical protein
MIRPGRDRHTRGVDSFIFAPGRRPCRGPNRFNQTS